MKVTPVAKILLAPLWCTLVGGVGVALGQRPVPTNLRGNTNAGNRNRQRDSSGSLLSSQPNESVSTSSEPNPSSSLRNHQEVQEPMGLGVLVNHFTSTHRQKQQQQQLLQDWAFCSTSDECNNGCCSNFYSDDGQYRCTRLQNGYQADLCRVSNGGENTQKSVGYLGDWDLCSASDECDNGCCSNFYSDDGRFKCTPLEGGYQSDLCLAAHGVAFAFTDDSTFSPSEGGSDFATDVVGTFSPTEAGTFSETDAGTFAASSAGTFVPTDDGTFSPTDGGGSGSAQYGLQADCNQDDSSKFNICLDFASVDGSSKAWMDHALAAKDRWERVLVGDTFSAINSQELQGIEVATTLPAFVDDLYIAVVEGDIDGNGNILGYASPTFFKNNGGHVLPIAGLITLDTADISDNSLQGLIEHEMGHVLGFGTLFADNGLHSGNGNDSTYTGENALQAWRDMGCSGDIPIETDGGEATAGAHWDEECLVGELMTGYIGGGNYLSRLTVGAMMDLGYNVNMNAADPFSLDQLSGGQCASYCPEAAGAFSVASSSSTMASNSSTIKARNRVADDAPDRHAIMTVAATVLQRNRANRPLSLREGYQYVGGDFISVFTKGSNGGVQETTIKWRDVEDFLNTRSSSP